MGCIITKKAKVKQYAEQSQNNKSSRMRQSINQIPARLVFRQEGSLNHQVAYHQE